MTVHYIISDERYRCGKRPLYNNSGSRIIEAVECLTCIEGYKYDNGLSSEYRLGGEYDKNGNPRMYRNTRDYKKAIEELREEIKELKLDMQRMAGIARLGILVNKEKEIREIEGKWKLGNIKN